MLTSRLRDVRQRRRNGERGAVLLELTLVVPVLVAIVLGMLEIGLAWRNSTVAVSATRQGARVGSHLAENAQSDREAIRAIEAVLGDDADNVVRIIIFEGFANAGQPPTDCLNAGTSYGGSSDCNVYDGATVFAHLADNTRWGCGGSALDRNWCPSSERSAAIRSADHLGVYIELTHEWTTNFFPAESRILRATTVMRLEPDPNP